MAKPNITTSIMGKILGRTPEVQWHLCFRQGELRWINRDTERESDQDAALRLLEEVPFRP